jgi:AcrR family transcriptional regulator
MGVTSCARRDTVLQMAAPSDSATVGAADAAEPRRELRARGQRTMRRLLDAGARVFAERGYHAARVDDVVKAARTSHGTFYLYFANKEDLFRALAVDVAQEMALLAAEFPQLDSKGFEANGQGVEALRAWLGQFADLYDRTARVIQVWTEAEISDSEFGRIGGDLVREFVARLAARIRPAAQDLDALVAATAIVAMIERTNYLRVSGSLTADRDALLDTLATVTYAGIHGATKT